MVLLAFVRLSTKAEVFPRPLTPDQAMDVVDARLSAPAAVVIEPTRDHARVVRRLLSEHGAGANLTTDAHLAALSIAHRCAVVSFDSDFGRFAGVDWRSPHRHRASMSGASASRSRRAWRSTSSLT